MKHFSTAFKISIVSLIFTIVTYAICTAAPPKKLADSLNTKQLLIVVTDDWNSVGGTLYCFEKQNGKWVKQFSNLVVVGSKGLGLGEGIIPFTSDGAPQKREGDKKSPAGIFKIGTAFGYADKYQAQWIKNPYIKATDTLICVDDIKSAYYNKLINNEPAKSDWNSFERMHIKYYKWGLFVDHNSNNPVSGMGSCIFMHIWENKNEGTDGCTAMKEKNLLRVLHWIDAAKHPLLVQFPKKEYLKLVSQYSLPVI